MNKNYCIRYEKVSKKFKITKSIRYICFFSGKSALKKDKLVVKVIETDFWNEGGVIHIEYVRKRKLLGGKGLCIKDENITHTNGYLEDVDKSSYLDGSKKKM